MKIISWNVNGINACIKNGLLNFIEQENADIYCLQEVKVAKENLNAQIQKLPNYKQYWLFAKQKGRSGLTIFTKKPPLAIQEGLGKQEFDCEARLLALEFKQYILINVYFPHASRDLSRLDFKLAFNKHFENFCKSKTKPLVIVGDINVAHKEIDLANPKQNKKNAGFTEQERAWLTQFLEAGYSDTFRSHNKEAGNYTWWTYRNNARQRNIGWRIDYAITSKSIQKNVQDSYILKDIKGSDHCPIGIKLKSLE